MIRNFTKLSRPLLMQKATRYSASAKRLAAPIACVPPARSMIIRSLSTQVASPIIVPNTNPFIPLQSVDPHSYSILECKFVDADNLVQMQSRAAVEFSDKPHFGVYQTDGTFKYISYKDFNSLVDYTRGVLDLMGVGVNDKVALISNNRVEWAAVFYATVGRGAQIVPMYEAQKEKDWQYIVENSGAKVIFAATERIYGTVKDYVNKVGQVKNVACFDAPVEHAYSYQSWLHRAKGATASKQADKDGAFFPAHIPAAEDLAAIIYTSGTTGNPKGVELSHSNICKDIDGARVIHSQTNIKPYNNLLSIFKERVAKNPSGPLKYNINLLAHNLSLCFLPWSHVYGLTCELNILTCAGGAMAIVPHRDLILQCLQAAKPTVIFSVPMLFNRVYDGVMKNISTLPPLKQKLARAALTTARARNEALEFERPVGAWLEWKFQLFDKLVLKGIRDKLGGNLRYMANGGAAAGTPVLQFFEDIGLPVADGYGLTETAPMLTVGGVGWGKRRIGCVGVALPGCDLRIVDPESLADMGYEEDGEIVANGPMVMRGYHRNEAANAECFFYRHPETKKTLTYEAFHALPAAQQQGYLRYFRTGDMGRLIENKYLKITGRIKEQYKLLNGKYVVPSPLEDVMNRFTGQQQCFLYGNNRSFNVLLVVPNYVELKNHFQALQKKQAIYDDVLTALDACLAEVAKFNQEGLDKHAAVVFKNEEFIRFITEGIVRQSKQLKNFERPAKWAPISMPFSAENQMLTPKLSLRRNNICKAYEHVLDELFDEHKNAGHLIDHGTKNCDA